VRLLRVSILAVVVLVCVTAEISEPGSALSGTRTSQNIFSMQAAALSQQGPPVRSPDSAAGQPGSWPQQGSKKKTVDVTKLKSNADELITLSQGLPTQLDQIGNGKLPKDLLDSLRKIEKLSKHMRSELE
jgi:hypothetical protein